MPTTFLEWNADAILPHAQPQQAPDLQVAIAAVRAAAQAAQDARRRPLESRTKGVAADVVTAADRAAEQAAAAILREHRPADGLLGEEGTEARGGGRRWVIDGVDGTVAFANRLLGWCSAVALEDAHGTKTAAVYDPTTQELHTAERGAGGMVARDPSGAEPARVRAPRPLAEAHVAVFLRQDRLVLPGVREIAHALIDAAGLFRHAGPGSLELAWVAAGRLDAWVQPAVDPWDWLPGALLVTEAGGEARVTDAHGIRWHLAGHPRLLDELEARLPLR